MDDTREKLEKEYCPPIDPALLSAILSDYDLSNHQSLQDARDILDSIKLSAFDANTDGFDPSGTTATDDATLSHSASHAEEGALSSEETDLTSVSNGVSSLNLSESTSDGVEGKGLGEYMDAVDKSDSATKADVLKTMFPATTEYTILHALKKCDSDFTRVMDELLNQSFIASEALAGGDPAVASKGVDAFSDQGISGRGRRKHSKKNAKFRSLDDYASGSTSPTPPESPWKSAARDVEFITARTQLSHKTVASLFHKHGASLANTIAALIELSAQDSAFAKVVSDDAIVLAHAYELGRDFPAIDVGDLTELIRLTHPSTAAAHQLAKALTSRPAGVGRIEVIPRYAPINVESDEQGGSWVDVPSPVRRVSRAPAASEPASLASTYAEASSRAFSQATAAYRRGKSDHLMAQAAGYYSQVGRDYAARSKEATAEAADALVEAQSSPGHVDLHGVSVRDAVRISRVKVAAWWRGRGRRAMGVDGRVRAEEGAGGGELVIVTGMGRHSRGGKGLLGPAIGRMLMQEGWEARCGEGHWIVLGKR